MKCPYCGKEVDAIYNMQEWMEQESAKGILSDRDYFDMDDYAQEHYDERYCKTCYENEKKTALGL